MGCGCGGGTAAKQSATTYEISDDPETPKRQYLTERQAVAERTNRQLSGSVQLASS